MERKWRSGREKKEGRRKENKFFFSLFETATH